MAEALPDAGRLGATLKPGTVLADRYRLESIVGAGTFGVVWRARHVHLETECAIKLFDPPPEADPQEASGRFLQEARLTARLKSPHVAQVFDYGVHERMPFLVLELLRGVSLAAHLAGLRERGQALLPRETARVIRHVAEALSVAHAARVVHRDLKPDNIFLVEEGQSYVAKVLDFGIAKWSADASPGLTTTRTVMGTPHYMSAEQFESARQVDHRADLWSLGVIAFECLTGQVPFPGATLIDVAFRVCKEGPLVASQIADVPAGFDAWFARATALGREYRFDSALEQAHALEQVCASAPQRVALASPQASLGESGATPPAVVGPAHAVLQSRLGRRAAAVSQTILQRALGSRRRRWLSTAALTGALLLWPAALALRSNGVAPPAALGTATPERAAGQAQDVRTGVALATPTQPPDVVIESANPSPNAPAIPTVPAVAPVVEHPPQTSPGPSQVAAPPPSKAAPQTAEVGPAKRAGKEDQKAAPASAPPATALLPRSIAPAVSASKSVAAPKSTASPRPAPITENVTDSGAGTAGAPKTPAAVEPGGGAPVATSVSEAAAVALGAAAQLASACRPRGGPTGPGKARIVYSNDGTVQSVEIMTAKFRETLTANCLRLVFRRARIAPFKGEPPTFIKSFAIPEE